MKYRKDENTNLYKRQIIYNRDVLDYKKYTIVKGNLITDDIISWIIENTTGYWSNSWSWYLFEMEEDALSFKLVWGI